jgi:hypothetical protein
MSYQEAISSLIDHLYTLRAKSSTASLKYDYYIEEGNKYARIVSQGDTQRSAVGFIVLKPVKNFVEGDILMAASWKAPATNFARGNIYKGDFSRVTQFGVI